MFFIFKKKGTIRNSRRCWLTSVLILGGSFQSFKNLYVHFQIVTVLTLHFWTSYHSQESSRHIPNTLFRHEGHVAFAGVLGNLTFPKGLSEIKRNAFRANIGSAQTRETCNPKIYHKEAEPSVPLALDDCSMSPKLWFPRRFNQSAI